MSAQTLTHQQMALALRALGDFSVMIRQEGDWYASVRAEIKEGAFLTEPTVSEETPFDAVAALFAIYTAPGALVVRPDRREVRWNGFMWEDAP